MSRPSHVISVAGAESGHPKLEHLSSPLEATPDTANICPTDTDAIVPRKQKHKVDKQSTEYIVKSGIAGGLAGCAVRTAHHLSATPHLTSFCRPKPSSVPLTESKSSFKPRVPNSQNTPAPGSAS